MLGIKSSSSVVDVVQNFASLGFILIRFCIFIFYSSKSLPWDEDTFIGWFCTFMYSVIFAGVYLLLNAYILSCFVTICVQFHSFRVHFEKIVLKLDGISEKDAEYGLKIKRILCEAMEFHIMIKEYV